MSGPAFELRLGDRWNRRVLMGPACWLWQGRPDNVGYGRISIDGRQVRTHRVAWMLAHGAIPVGMYVLHRCDNRLCVNPDHLFLGSHLDNVEDMLRKGRGSKPPLHNGEDHPQAKLSAEDVREIWRRAAWVGRRGIQRTLAREYGVSETTLSAIVHRKTWRESA